MEKQLISLLKDLAIKSFLSITDVECIAEKDSEILKFNISSDEPNILIGKYGETLFALQQVFRLMAENKMGRENIPHIILDVDGYRDNQTENAVHMAEEAIRKMERFEKTRIELPSMPSYKRRAVHFYIVENYPEIETESTGFGPDRRIVLSKKQ